MHQPSTMAQWSHFLPIRRRVVRLPRLIGATGVALYNVAGLCFFIDAGKLCARCCARTTTSYGREKEVPPLRAGPPCRPVPIESWGRANCFHALSSLGISFRFRGHRTGIGPRRTSARHTSRSMVWAASRAAAPEQNNNWAGMLFTKFSPVVVARREF